MDSNAPRSAGFYDFLGWIEANKKRVAIGAAAVLFAVLVVGILVWRSGEREVDAELALSAVPMPTSPSDPVAPGTGDAFAKVAAEYSGTQAAAKALIRAGTAYFAEGKYAKAREQFDAYLREFGATPWVPEALLGIAASLEAENKIPEAITKYKDFLSTYGTAPSADMARFNLARLYEQSNQPQLALETLTAMLKAQTAGGPPSPSAQEAQMKMRALLAKNPGLMPTNAAPARAPQQPPLVLKPQEPGGATPPVIVNPAQPTPGQPNPSGEAPKIIVNPTAPGSGQPTPAPSAPAQPAPPAK
jgi:tetratricopeptide (TPR) repeat protein